MLFRTWAPELSPGLAPGVAWMQPAPWIQARIPPFDENAHTVVSAYRCIRIQVCPCIPHPSKYLHTELCLRTQGYLEPACCACLLLGCSTCGCQPRISTMSLQAVPRVSYCAGTMCGQCMPTFLHRFAATCVAKYVRSFTDVDDGRPWSDDYL